MSSKVLRLDKLNINQTKLLNEISFQVRKKFDDFIAQISFPHAGNLDWLVSTPASRDLYLSSLFRNLCDLYLIKRLLGRGENYDIIIVDNFAFKAVLDDFLKQNDYKIKVSYKTGFLKSVLIVIKRFVSLFIHSLVRFFVIGKRSGQFKPAKAVTLLDCFVLKSSIKGNKYHDRYYTGLFEFIGEEEKQNFYYLPEYAFGFCDSIRSFKKIRKLDDNFLVKDDFLKISDYLYALLYWFRVLRIITVKSSVDDFELQSLVKYELYFRSVNLSSYNALLNYCFVKRLQERNIKIKKLIDWNENQVIDKGLISGFHEFYPDVKILGYRGYIISDQYIHVFPTSFEKSNGVIPDTIAVTGKVLIEPLKEFCPDLVVVSAPAFRFSHLWEERKFEPDPEYFTVLVALPLSLEESRYILNLVRRTITKLDENTIFLLKAHPINTQETIRNLLGKAWPRRFQFVTGDFCSAVERSNLVISKNSCVCVETIAKGVPIIIIALESDFLKNPIPAGSDEKIWKIVYTENELLEAINYFRIKSKDQNTSNIYKLIGEEIREKYFEPVTEESSRRFLMTE